LAGALPYSLRQGLLRGIHTLPAVSGTVLELAISSDAQGFRLAREPKRVTLEIARAPGVSWDSFAPEGPPGPRSLQVVVLDPGHGGPGAGRPGRGGAGRTAAREC